MSFLDIKDPKKRDAIVADYLATMNRIQQRNLNEKAQDLAHSDELKEMFHPIIESTKKSTKAITKELEPLQEEMKNINENFLHITTTTTTPTKQNKRWMQDMNVKALDYYLNTFNKEKLDKYFGIQLTADNELMMGDRSVGVDNNSTISIDNAMYKGTTGLWSLIMLASPRKTMYTPEDLENYEDLVARTRVASHPRGTERGISRPKSTYKWKTFFAATAAGNVSDDDVNDDDYLSAHDGDGMQFLPGDIKGLKVKLNLLLAEFRAGNTQATRNEIVYILDELLRRKQISRKEYNEINKYLSRCL